MKIGEGIAKKIPQSHSLSPFSFLDLLSNVLIKSLGLLESRSGVGFNNENKTTHLPLSEENTVVCLTFDSLVVIHGICLFIFLIVG